MILAMQEIQTAEPSSCLLFTETSILAGTDRFYEIELKDFKIDGESLLFCKILAYDSNSRCKSFVMLTATVTRAGIRQQLDLYILKCGLSVRSCTGPTASLKSPAIPEKAGAA